MKMYVLDNGVIRMDTDERVTGGESASIPIHSFLFETPQGYLLFDSGCDPEGMSGVWPGAMRKNPYLPGFHGTVPERLNDLGINPKDIRFAVMSHLHIDHAGCLKFFTDAEVFVNREEFRRVMQDYAEERMNGFHLKSDVDNWLKAGIHWNFINEEQSSFDLMPGIRILNFGPGHSYGMLGIEATLSKGRKFLLVSDAIYAKSNIGPPVQVPGIVCDPEGYKKTVHRILEISRTENAKVLFGHDSGQFAALTKSDRGFYE